jgi:hypothetical protein
MMGSLVASYHAYEDLLDKTTKGNQSIAYRYNYTGINYLMNVLNPVLRMWIGIQTGPGSGFALGMLSRIQE